MTIKAIFYSRFLAKKGTTVLHQVPEGSITGSSPLFSFDSIRSYLTPPAEFCDRLTTLCISHYRLLGYPVRIVSEKYNRNAFQFNFCIVLEEKADASSYKSVVKKLARLFRAVETQSNFLSKDEDGLIEDEEHVTWKNGRGQVYKLIEAIMEDLNNYCECMIPIDQFSTVNLKLFPILPPPPPVKAYHVPISTVKLSLLTDTSWDLTMLKIVPYIDGLNSVRRISELAETDYELTRRCISHLLYYSCIILVDVFQFSNIYAPTPLLTTFIASPEMQAECASYVAAGTVLSGAELCALYASMRQGLSVKSWAIDSTERLQGIDIRRFIGFGVVKGFLYRVHKWCYLPRTEPEIEKLGRLTIEETPLPLLKYLDGRHCFDEISSDLRISEKEILTKLKAYGDVQIIHR